MLAESRWRIDAVHLGPADYSLSRQLPVDYRLGNLEVAQRLELLIDKCRARSIQVMVPCFPADGETAKRLLDMGCNHAGRSISAVKQQLQ